MKTLFTSLGITGPPAMRAEVFGILLAGLRKERISLIVTVGRDLQPARFGSQPDGTGPGRGPSATLPWQAHRRRTERGPKAMTLAAIVQD